MLAELVEPVYALQETDGEAAADEWVVCFGTLPDPEIKDCHCRKASFDRKRRKRERGTYFPGKRQDKLRLRMNATMIKFGNIQD